MNSQNEFIKSVLSQGLSWCTVTLISYTCTWKEADEKTLDLNFSNYWFDLTALFFKKKNQIQNTAQDFDIKFYKLHVC